MAWDKNRREGTHDVDWPNSTVVDSTGGFSRTKRQQSSGSPLIQAPVRPELS